MNHAAALMLFALVAARGGADEANATGVHARVRIAMVPVRTVWVSPRQLEVARQESARLWAAYGVELVWMQLKSECPSAAAADLCLYAIFESKLGSPRGGVGEPTLGQVDLSHAGRLHSEVRVGYETVADMLARWDRRFGPDGPMPLRNQTVGRALGRVLAHEVGHLLIGLPLHSQSGLMRQSFGARDLANRSADPFALTQFDVARLRSRLAWLRSLRTPSALSPVSERD